jgi:hypothetical protein
MTFDEIKDKVNELKNELKKEPSKDNYINYLLVALMSGIYTPPRRSEWVYVKIKNFNKDTDNYYDKNMFHFNIYKTVEKYGKQTLECPKELKPVITKWIKLNPTEYLFYNTSNNKQFSKPDLTKRLYKIFGKKISVDMMRSIFLSNYYKEIPRLQEMEKIANEMGHDIKSGIEFYTKK